ncbi:hypothetical protein [Enterococcus gilvus]|uniref:Uncharacterized protein n=2 Tax=Enterococcus gilvus TaxID=160453 RepID=R2Y4Q3_9ENTE|nr:hypothetical protein [Enterococcus gilvus]EOI57312.1 hypothetical protein UKC_01526 [Enterococcus gilvus ATCC BAA-350]EOW83114.1 hypothetical protein I592_02441 [Enterococcus gilvus ATCC BAA-350]
MEENITIEFVKEWIDKHNLSKGSFDRIMSDLIYNSGHYYIDDPSLRYWLIDNTYKFRDMLPVELNSNQQIVLEWLKSNSNALKVPMLAIYELAELADEKVRAAYRQLNREEEFQVLAAFAEWGMKEVAE